MRRRGRACALQILYQLEMGKLIGDPGGAHRASNDPVPDREAIAHAVMRYWESFDPVDPADRKFAERLVDGVVGSVPALDAALAAVSHHWKVARMDRVDRNLLRLGAYEILHCPDIPRTASINEAIEIAKRFSGIDAAAFVNGVLDQLQKPAPAEEAAPATVAQLPRAAPAEA